MAVPGTQFQLPQAVAGTPSDNAFDPTNAGAFLNNFNDLSVVYQPAAQQGQTSMDTQRLNDLIAAYQYVSDPANQATLDAQNYAGYSNYIMQELQPAITEENNLVQYNTTQANYNNLGTQLTNVNNQLTKYADNGENGAGFNSWLSDYGNTLANPSKYGNPVTNPGGVRSMQYQVYQNWLGQLQSQVPQIQQQMQAAQTAQNTAQGNVLSGFTLTNPDYANANQQVQNYYNNPTTGQVALSTQAADQDLYQMAYNLKNQINQQANVAGANSSGERQQAIGNANAQAAQQSAQLYNQAENQATAAINAQQQKTQQEQVQQQALTDSVKQGNINNLFDTSTQNAVSAYNANVGAQNQANTANAEQGIQQAQANSSLWNNIFGQTGSGLGATAGTAVGGLI